MGKRKIQKTLLGVLSLLGVLVAPTWDDHRPALADTTTTSSTSTSTSSTTTTTIAPSTTTTSSTTTTVAGNVKRFTSAVMSLIDNSEREIQARIWVYYSAGKDYRWGYNSDCSAQGTVSWQYSISPNHGSANIEHSGTSGPLWGFCGEVGHFSSFHQYGLTPGTTYTVCATVSHTTGGTVSACRAVTTLSDQSATTTTIITTTSTTSPQGATTTTNPSTTSTTVSGGFMVLLDTQSRAVEVMTRQAYLAAGPTIGNGGCGCYTWVSSSYSPSLGMAHDGKGGFAWPTTTTTTTTTTTVAPTTTSTVASTTTAAPGDIQIQSTSTTQANTSGNTAASTTVAPSQQSAVVDGATTTQAPASQTTPSTVAPVVPGEAVVEIGGEEVQASVEVNQEEGVATVSAGEVVASVSGSQVNEGSADAPENALVFAAGDEVSVSASGFEPDSEVDATIYSTPRNLGKLSVDAQGNVTAEITLPSDMETGNHTLVLSGVDQNKNPIAVKFGLIVYANETSIPGWIYGLMALLVLVLAASIGVNVRQRARLA